jgi:hypothetical protein
VRLPSLTLPTVVVSVPPPEAWICEATSPPWIVVALPPPKDMTAEGA